MEANQNRTTHAHTHMHYDTHTYLAAVPDAVPAEELARVEVAPQAHGQELLGSPLVQVHGAHEGEVHTCVKGVGVGCGGGGLLLDGLERPGGLAVGRGVLFVNRAYRGSGAWRSSCSR